MKNSKLKFLIWGYGVIGMILGSSICYASIKLSPGSIYPTILGVLCGAYAFVGFEIIPCMIKGKD